MTGDRRRLACVAAIALLAGACQMHGASAAPTAPVSWRCPELRWEAFPSAADLARDAQGRLAAAERVSYQLRVFEASSGALVYEKLGLSESRHRPDLPLRQSRHYVWTVRPVFWLDGRRRVGDWLGRHPTRSGACETVRTPRVPLPLELFPEVVPEPADASTGGESKGSCRP
jgi:hypothetical protein